tara:strand:- start:9076 stop:9807 length:732 start_codon:yes stop_codon:yes gene_type:complete
MSLLIKDIYLELGGKSIVEKVSISIRPGEIVGLLGPNGAGKTTTFNIAVGLLKPDLGNIFLDNKCITELNLSMRSRLGLGYLAQESSVFRNLTVRENIDLALMQNNYPYGLLRSKREKLIKEFNLNSFIDALGCQLSGGERRRCEIARALAVGRNGPKYLLLDEPFAGIDPISVNDLQSLIYKLSNNGVGILITDHNVRETLSITTRSFILSEGKILASGKSLELAENKLVKKYYLGQNFSLN